MHAAVCQSVPQSTVSLIVVAVLVAGHSALVPWPVPAYVWTAWQNATARTRACHVAHHR